jgi:glucose/arabinose dehydrogenase
VAETVHVVAQGMNNPNGVAFRDGALYVAEVSRILRYDAIESRLEDPPAPVVIYDGLPTETHHGWKFIRFGPDGMLYVPVGAPCNICRPSDERFMTILRMRPDGSEMEIYARGVRNSVGFDWHPETGVLWFNDNGRDGLGDDIPPDELNRAPEGGLHFGFPYCHGGIIADPEYGEGRDCTEFVAPALGLDAHVAPLGMRFYDGAMFPPEYRQRIFIAQHGSWNRSVPDGYRIITVTVADGAVVASETFIDGWLVAGEAWGRPVDVAVMPDGALLVSDDRAGRVYRVTYQR